MDYSFEHEAYLKGYTAVCGIDEAGRGPLAGPVYAAAVWLPEGLVIDGLNDSKKLSEKKREALFDVIKENAVAYGIGFADEKEIDEINILQATYLAMRRAYDNMQKACDYVLIDGNRMPPMPVPGETIVKGDATGYSIAGVLPGTYTMKVMKQNHVTREYTVTVGSSNVVQDIILYLRGDANMDGKISLMDVNRIIRHLASWSVEINLDNADYDANGKVNLVDVSKLIKLLAGK